MNERSLRAALISIDPGFSDHVRTALAQADLGVVLALEASVRFAQFDEEHVQALRKLGSQNTAPQPNAPASTSG